MLTPADIQRVIAQYDAEVRRNTTAAYDAVLAVAECEDDDIMWEVIEVAERMGFELEESSSHPADLDALQDAADAYQARLRAELGRPRSAMNVT